MSNDPKDLSTYAILEYLEGMEEYAKIKVATPHADIVLSVLDIRVLIEGLRRALEPIRYED